MGREVAHMQQSALAHTRFFPISCHDCNLSSRHMCPMKGWDVIVTHLRPHICLQLFFHKGVRQYRTGVGQLHKALSYIYPILPRTFLPQMDFIMIQTPSLVGYHDRYRPKVSSSKGHDKCGHVKDDLIEQKNLLI
jgi:hypothetical protein